MSLNSIANRLTPSAPTEITFGAQPIATGRKFTTIFGHRAAAGGSGLNYTPYTVVNVGDPTAALAEVDALAGSGSQIGKMAQAFVKANSAANRSSFPAFRVVILANADVGFGGADEAIVAVRNLRSDMFVSPYPASDATRRATLLALCSLISGPDRNLQGQFGSFATFGSLEALATAILYAINDRFALVAYFQDTNTALVNTTGDTTAASHTLTALASVAGINLGALVTGTGIPANTFVGAIRATEVDLVNASGVFVNATSTNAAEALAFQNLVSQEDEIVAAAHAGAMMSSAYPYNPLQNVVVGGLLPPKKTSDIIAFDPAGASESALVAGLSPLSVIPGNLVAFIRTRTTFTTLPGNITVTDYFDWQQIVVLYDFRENLYQISQNPPFNNNPGGTKASAQIAAKFKDEVLRVAGIFEETGAFQDVKALAKYFFVQISTTSKGRFDYRIPVEAIPGLYVIAGNIQAVSSVQSALLTSTI